MVSKNGNVVTSEFFKANKPPEWLDVDSIAGMNTDSKLVNQYKEDKHVKETNVP